MDNNTIQEINKYKAEIANVEITTNAAKTQFLRQLQEGMGDEIEATLKECEAKELTGWQRFKNKLQNIL